MVLKDRKYISCITLATSNVMIYFQGGTGVSKCLLWHINLMANLERSSQAEYAACHAFSFGFGFLHAGPRRDTIFMNIFNSTIT